MAVAERRRGGFTLVELLVVIGIIALLIAILIPSLTKACDAGYRIAFGSNNHANSLQKNVVYFDGQVPCRSTALAGYRNDTIYTMDGSGTSQGCGTSNIYTNSTQFVLTAESPMISGSDSMMQPSDGALTIGVGVGIE